MLLDSLRVEPSGVPIYVQIREQVLRALGAGVLRPGERMPTMRQVAVVLKVDLNTVRHAYDALARLGVISVLPARGTFVAERPPALDPAAERDRLDDFVHRTIAAAAANGLDPAAVGRRILAIAERKEDRDA
jgi:GntR family transcriptional regulator